jgi:hypothetical protein
VQSVRSHERLLAWIYTGPVGHLYGTVADVTQLWLLYLGDRIRHTLKPHGLDA